MQHRRVRYYTEKQGKTLGDKARWGINDPKDVS